MHLCYLQYVFYNGAVNLTADQVYQALLEKNTDAINDWALTQYTNTVITTGANVDSIYFKYPASPLSSPSD